MFSVGRGVTQGGPFSPHIFNVVVDAVVQEWLHQKLGVEFTRQGLGDLAQTILVAFYADDSVLSARCPEWLQNSFTILVGLFKHGVGLCTNAQKMKVMMCIPDKIRVSMTEKVYNDYCQEASTHATRKHLRVECNICGQSMQAASLQHHLELQHDVYHSFVLNRDLEGECLPATFQADEDTKTGSYCCPVPGCCGGAHIVFDIPRI